MSAVAITKTLIFGIPSAYLVTVTAVWLYRKLRRRRAEWRAAADIARRVQERRAEIAHLNQLYASESAGDRP